METKTGSAETERTPERREQAATAVWCVPQSAVTIEYSRKVFDEIRLKVMDAFFSLPRGGAEIGGVLLGKHSNGRVLISDYVALECEHATGPSFTLSPRDHTRLAALIAAARRSSEDKQPVGWYHSHTRTEIFFSDADRSVHELYFPEPWQMAVVLKPHTFQPMRAGFFVREANGEIYCPASRQEIIIEPLTAPAAGPAAEEPKDETPAIPARRREPAVDRTATDAVRPVAAAAEVKAAEKSAPEPIPTATSEVAAPSFTQLAAPSFTQVAPARSWRGWGAVLAVVIGVGIGAGAYATRDMWLTAAISWTRPRPSAGAGTGIPSSGMGLRALDTDGQLWIVWDRSSAAVARASGGTLVIHDGPLTHAVELDAAHLQSGSFTYGRQSERIDIALTLTLPNGDKPREVATYLGKLPEREAAQPAVDPLRMQNRKLATDLNAERARSKKLQEDMTKMKREQQLQRLEKQNPQ